MAESRRGPMEAKVTRLPAYLGATASSDIARGGRAPRNGQPAAEGPGQPPLSPEHAKARPHVAAGPLFQRWGGCPPEVLRYQAISGFAPRLP